MSTLRINEKVSKYRMKTLLHLRSIISCELVSEKVQRPSYESKEHNFFFTSSFLSS